MNEALKLVCYHGMGEKYNWQKFEQKLLKLSAYM